MSEPSTASNPPHSLLRSPLTARGKASALHVDLGEELKAAVQAAAQRVGMRPSDWVRSQLAAAVSGADAGEYGLSEIRGRAASEPVDLFAIPRACQLTLQPDDVEPLDRIAAAGGFRSRPAALRFVLRQHEDPATRAAFRELPKSIPALAESNMTLQLAVRMTQAVGSAGSGAAGLDPTLRRDIQTHMEKAARVIAALQPLMSPRR